MHVPVVPHIVRPREPRWPAYIHACMHACKLTYIHAGGWSGGQLIYMHASSYKGVQGGGHGCFTTYLLPAHLLTHIHAGGRTCARSSGDAYIHTCMHACMHTCRGPDLRAELGIGPDVTVFGRHGGWNVFDIFEARFANHLVHFS